MSINVYKCLYKFVLGDINAQGGDSPHLQLSAPYYICLGNICFKCLDISAFQTLFYQMHISGYVCKCLSLQGHAIVCVGWNEKYIIDVQF